MSGSMEAMTRLEASQPREGIDDSEWKVKQEQKSQLLGDGERFFQALVEDGILSSELTDDRIRDKWVVPTYCPQRIV